MGQARDHGYRVELLPPPDWEQGRLRQWFPCRSEQPSRDVPSMLTKN